MVFQLGMVSVSFVCRYGVLWNTENGFYCWGLGEDWGNGAIPLLILYRVGGVLRFF
jgi:hypothetical protein